MKRFILAILLMFIFTGCNSSTFKTINYDSLLKKIESKETFIILFNDESTDAKILKKTLQNVLNENEIKAYLINSSDISLNQKNELRKYVSYEDLSIVFIKDGLDSSKLSHITDAETKENVIENHLNNLGFIKK